MLTPWIFMLIVVVLFGWISNSDDIKKYLLMVCIGLLLGLVVAVLAGPFVPREVNTSLVELEPLETSAGYDIYLQKCHSDSIYIQEYLPDDFYLYKANGYIWMTVISDYDQIILSHEAYLEQTTVGPEFAEGYKWLRFFTLIEEGGDEYNRFYLPVDSWRQMP